jgi:hypothetical protein
MGRPPAGRRDITRCLFFQYTVFGREERIMHCSTSVTAQLVRSTLALASIVGALVFTPSFWPAMGLLALAIHFMRGCPACWLGGLLEAIQARKQRKPLS